MPSLSPSLASPPCPWRSASSRGAGGAGGGMGPHLRGMDPKPVPSVGRGLWGDPEPAAGTVRLSMELAQASTCSPHPFPPVPSLPPAAPRPWPDPDAGVAAAKLQKQSEPFEAGGESLGGVGGPEAAAWGRLLRQCGGSTERRGGGQEGGMAEGRRQGQKVPVGCWSSLLYSTSCCC